MPTNIVPSPEISKSKFTYSFQSCTRNPDFQGGILVPFIPCQEYNNSSHNINDGHIIYDHVFGVVETTPKWITTLLRSDGFFYKTDNLKGSKSRKVLACERFFNFYEPLYQKRKVSLLLFTFSRANFARLDIKTVLEVLKKRVRSLKWHWRAYMWVFEIAANPKFKGGFHLHYHLVIALDRIEIEKFPEKMKLSALWGQRVQVQFIKKSLKSYMSKYLYKSEGKVNGYRSYQVSQKLL